MKLEQLAKGAQISGIEPGKVVRVVSADPLGDNAVTVVYKADDGRLGERVLFRSNECELSIASVGKLQFSGVAEEVLMLFTQRPGVKVRISVEIEAESPSGFDDGIQRAARENCDQLKFKNRAFED